MYADQNSMNNPISTFFFHIYKSEESVDIILHTRSERNSPLFFVSSSEHKVLMVSYCDQSVIVVVVCRPQFALKATFS